MPEDTYFMKLALLDAQKAFDINEIPVGCIITCRGQIISHGFNRRNQENNVLAHAEIIAINKACKKLKSWRLENCVLYVTVEPCAMCAGAILQARIPKLVFGCKNKKAGCAGSILNLLDNNDFNHRVQITSGVMEDECRQIVQNFFVKLRSEKFYSNKEK